MAPAHYFDHTADIGMEIEAASLEELLQDGVLGLTGLICAEPDRVESRDERTISLGPGEPPDLFVDLLREMLFLFEMEGFLAREALVTRDAIGGVLATLRGERFDPARHVANHEVKAVTYHELEVAERDGRWRARVVLDI